jgi:hypothetical protein
VEGGQVGSVGLVTGIGRLAELFSGKGRDDPGLEAGGGEGALDEAMLAASAFDGDDQVAEVVRLEGLAELSDGGGEGGAVVLDDGRRDEDLAVEVGKHPLGAGLGTVDGDDAEVLGPDLLNARMDGARRFVQNLRGAVTGTATGRGGQSNCFQRRGKGYPNPRRR